MNPTTVVRFFSAENYQDLEVLLERNSKRNPSWEIISISHALIPAGVSVACVLRYIGTSASYSIFDAS